MKIYRHVFALIFASFVGSATAAEIVKLGLAQNEAVQDVAASLITEIYRRAGLTPLIVPLPAARVTMLVLKNELDGEVARIGPYFEKNPSLIKVEPPYYFLTTTAFIKTDRGIVLNSPEDLKKYRVGIIRGVKHAEIATEGVEKLDVTDSVHQLFQMLNLGRIDVAVDVRINGQDMINQFQLKNVVPILDLAKRDSFNALIQSKGDLAIKISKVIKEMQANGELNKLIVEFEKKRLAQTEKQEEIKKK